MAAQSTSPKLLDPSELGTKQYWENIYVRELTNNKANADDEGTIWFEENGAEEAILKLLGGLAKAGKVMRNVEEHSDSRMQDKTSPAITPARFLDLGTGNGHLLFALREEDDDEDDDEEEDNNAKGPWTGELVGVDYSEKGVQLARRLASQRQIENIRFETWDLLADPPGSWAQGGFEIVLDKGTFDAISLMPRTDESSVHPCAIYRERVTPLIKPGYFLCITSCNWTRQELIGWLASEGSELSLCDEVRYPTFTFGGHTGQSIITLLFQRKEALS